MPSVMKTLLLNPPSFDQFDGGASSRWPATREIESYWYPVWLAYPAGMLPGSRLLDAPPHKISAKQTIEISKDYEFVVVFTSTVGIHSDLKLARAMKEASTRSENRLRWARMCKSNRPKPCWLALILILWSVTNSIILSWIMRMASLSPKSPMSRI